MYERAREPKKLIVLRITHYEIYAGKWLAESSHGLRSSGLSAS